jgi:hypothetical protein
MSLLTSETELRSWFREIDRDAVDLPDGLRFPLRVDEGLTWVVGPRAYLLLDSERGRGRGIVFHRGTEALPQVAAMCEWCHAVRAHARIRLMSVRADERRRLGLYLCSDLGCLTRGTELPEPDDLRERVEADEQRRRTLSRIRDFASRRLF